jgi:hypothetical protein
VTSSDWKGGLKDVHWSHSPPYSLRLSPPAPSHSLGPPGPAARAQPTASRGRHSALLLRSLRGHGDGTGEATCTSGRTGRLAGQRRRPTSWAQARIQLPASRGRRGRGKRVGAGKRQLLDAIVLYGLTIADMVWCPSYPRQYDLSLRVVASCSVHPVTRVSKQHRQAMQSALVRRWVRPCDAGNGKRME